MGQLRYRATAINEEFLKESQFFYSRPFSTPDDMVFIHKIPVYRWGLITTLEAEIRLHTKDNLVTVDVYDGTSMMTRGVYAPFYYKEDYENDDVLRIIIKNIDKECKRLGFVRED